MFSYCWADVYADKGRSKKVLVAKKEAEATHMAFFYDERDARGDMEAFMKAAVENTEIVVAFVSSNYAKSKNCRLELEYAKQLGKVRARWGCSASERLPRRRLTATDSRALPPWHSPSSLSTRVA
jgi:hypothetical protein